MEQQDLDNLIKVDVIASGYEWICPACKHFNKAISWRETFICSSCGQIVKAGLPEHALD